jgi:multiple RNA-binding domain-containing protein 1
MQADGQGQQHHFSGAGDGGAEAAAAEAAIRESGRLFVRNLAYTAGQLELSELFGAHGDLEEVHLVLDRWVGLGWRCCGMV